MTEELVIERFEEVLDNVEDIDFTHDELKNNGELTYFQYSIVELSGEGYPELMVRAGVDDEDYTPIVRVYSVNDDGDIVSPQETLISEGLGQGAGDMYALYALADGSGLAQGALKADEFTVTVYAILEPDQPQEFEAISPLDGGKKRIYT